MDRILSIDPIKQLKILVKCPHKFNALSYTINDDMNFGKTDGGFYSKFRIRLTSNNVNGSAYLSISSVEFWGVLEMIWKSM